MRAVLVPLVVVVLAAGVLLGGCSRNPKKQPLKLDQRFSVNVIKVPEYWPREKLDWSRDAQQRAVQQETYARYGRPDFIRRVYTFDNRIVRPGELGPHSVLMGQRPEPLSQWLYLDQKIAVTFQGGAKHEVIDLPDQVRIVALHGDPNDIKNFPVDGIERTSFYYYNHGREFVFVNGVLTQTKNLGAGMPAATELR